MSLPFKDSGCVGSIDGVCCSAPAVSCLHLAAFMLFAAVYLVRPIGTKWFWDLRTNLDPATSVTIRLSL